MADTTPRADVSADSATPAETYEIIADRADPSIQRMLDISKRSRSSAKTLLLEDEEPILQAIHAKIKVKEVYLAQNATMPEQLDSVLRYRHIRVRKVANELMGTIFPTDKKPKIFAIAVALKPAELTALNDYKQDIVVLDGVKIVGNIGAIIRTSYALGIAGVVLINSDLARITDRRLIRASRGYVFSLPVILASQDEVAQYLQDNNIRPVILDAHGNTPLRSLSQQEDRLAFVMGSEKHGSSLQDAQHNDELITVSIPMIDDVESLNVSVATGIALQQRMEHNINLYQENH